MSKHNITLCRYSENMQVIAGLSVPLVAEHCQKNLPSSHQRPQGRVAAMPPTLDDHMIQCNATTSHPALVQLSLILIFTQPRAV